MIRTLLGAIAFTGSICAPGETSAPIVLSFELRGDLVVVPAKVNDHTALLILDSGSGVTTLDSTFAAEAGVSKDGPTVNVVGNTSSRTRLGTARLEVGGIILDKVLVAATGGLAAVRGSVGYDVHGTMGYELFAHCVTVVDYQHRTLTLIEPASFTYSGPGVAIPVTTSARVPVAEATLVTRQRGSVPVRLTLDLGSTGHALRIASRVVSAHDLAGDTASVVGVLGIGVGGVARGRLMRLPALELGGLTIARPSTALSLEREGAFGATAPTDGTVGAAVFKRARVIFDYSRKRVVFEPRERLDVPDSVDGSGLTIGTEAGTDRLIRVIFVVEGSAADAAGMRAGDVLLEVDGKPVAATSVASIRASWRAYGETRRVAVLRDGRRVEVAVTLRPIM